MTPAVNDLEIWGSDAWKKKQGEGKRFLKYHHKGQLGDAENWQGAFKEQIENFATYQQDEANAWELQAKRVKGEIDPKSRKIDRSDPGSRLTKQHVFHQDARMGLIACPRLQPRKTD